VHLLVGKVDGHWLFFGVDSSEAESNRLNMWTDSVHAFYIAKRIDQISINRDDLPSWSWRRGERGTFKAE
jgi:hypothetical protein